MKKGFGIVEVLIAAVVLGFLIVGLNQLQKGNRESVLRIRARDVAQNIATEVIDSLRRVGLSTVIANGDIEGLEKERIFEGASGEVPVIYIVSVILDEDVEEVFSNDEQSGLIRANSLAAGEEAGENRLAYNFARRIDVNVEWNFKQSVQSIQVSEVIK